MPQTEKKENEKIVEEEKKAETTEVKEVSEEEVVTKVKADLPIDETKTYTAKELEEHVTKATRSGFSIAKNQLNDNITKLKSKVGTLESEKIALDSKVAELVKAGDTEKAKEEQAKVDELKKELDLTAKKLEVMEDAGAKAIKEVQTLRGEITKKELDNYRLKKISEAGGDIIPELVSGNTVEEIDASVAVAKKKHEEYEASLRKKLNIPAEKKKEQEEDKEIPIPDVALTNKASVKDWEKDRAQITADVYRQHGFEI